MQIAPEIVYHGVARSEWVESYILERMQRLDKFAQGITRCHVTLTREQASPQHDLAIKKEKEIREMRTQLPAVINLAFGAIERQLKKTAELRRYEQKDRSDEQPHGIVEKLFADGYGFIRTVGENRQFYFHRNSVLHDAFERLAVGTEVRFSAEEGERGPQASSVQIVSKPGALSER